MWRPSWSPWTEGGADVKKRNAGFDSSLIVELLCCLLGSCAFCSALLPALGQEVSDDDFAMLEKLSSLTGLPVPQRLAELKDKAERFTQVVEKFQMKEVVDSLVDRKIDR